MLDLQLVALDILCVLLALHPGWLISRAGSKVLNRAITYVSHASHHK